MITSSSHMLGRHGDEDVEIQVDEYTEGVVVLTLTTAPPVLSVAVTLDEADCRLLRSALHVPPSAR